MGQQQHSGCCGSTWMRGRTVRSESFVLASPNCPLFLFSWKVGERNTLPHMATEEVMTRRKQLPNRVRVELSYALAHLDEFNSKSREKQADWCAKRNSLLYRRQLSACEVPCQWARTPMTSTKYNLLYWSYIHLLRSAKEGRVTRNQDDSGFIRFGGNDSRRRLFSTGQITRRSKTLLGYGMAWLVH